MGLSCWSKGDPEAAHWSLAEATSKTRMGDIYFSINGASVLAELRTVQGRLHEAAYALADALQLAGSRGYETAEV